MDMVGDRVKENARTLLRKPENRDKTLVEVYKAELEKELEKYDDVQLDTQEGREKYVELMNFMNRFFGGSGRVDNILTAVEEAPQSELRREISERINIIEGRKGNIRNISEFFEEVITKTHPDHVSWERHLDRVTERSKLKIRNEANYIVNELITFENQIQNLEMQLKIPRPFAAGKIDRWNNAAIKAKYEELHSRFDKVASTVVATDRTGKAIYQELNAQLENLRNKFHTVGDHWHKLETIDFEPVADPGGIREAGVAADVVSLGTRRDEESFIRAFGNFLTNVSVENPICIWRNKSTGEWITSTQLDLGKDKLKDWLLYPAGTAFDKIISMQNRGWIPANKAEAEKLESNVKRFIDHFREKTVISVADAPSVRVLENCQARLSAAANLFQFADQYYEGINSDLTLWTDDKGNYRWSDKLQPNWRKCDNVFEALPEFLMAERVINPNSTRAQALVDKFKERPGVKIPDYDTAVKNITGMGDEKYEKEVAIGRNALLDRQTLDVAKKARDLATDAVAPPRYFRYAEYDHLKISLEKFIATYVALLSNPWVDPLLLRNTEISINDLRKYVGILYRSIPGLAAQRQAQEPSVSDKSYEVSIGGERGLRSCLNALFAPSMPRNARRLEDWLPIDAKERMSIVDSESIPPSPTTPTPTEAELKARLRSTLRTLEKVAVETSPMIELEMGLERLRADVRELSFQKLSDYDQSLYELLSRPTRESVLKAAQRSKIAIDTFKARVQNLTRNDKDLKDEIDRHVKIVQAEQKDTTSVNYQNASSQIAKLTKASGETAEKLQAANTWLHLLEEESRVLDLYAPKSGDIGLVVTGLKKALQKRFENEKILSASKDLTALAASFISQARKSEGQIPPPPPPIPEVPL